VLDTNIYIHAIRSAAARQELAAFQRLRAPHLHQHAVVVAELLAGAADEAALARWHERWVAPFERVARVIAPGYGTWQEAARILVRLVAGGHISRTPVARGLFHDCLLAAGAREHGYILVTHNTRDFELIERVLPGLRYTPPFP